MALAQKLIASDNHSVPHELPVNPEWEKAEFRCYFMFDPRVFDVMNIEPPDTTKAIRLSEWSNE